MKILFVAKHGQHDNADEDAITHSLRSLGHEVICVHEQRRHRVGISLESVLADICLFLKWESYDEITAIAKRMPTFCWYFDLVSSQDPTLSNRMLFRRNWFNKVLPHCKLGFCTDGDWVAQDVTGKLRWLTQGMDERVAGFGTPLPDPQPPILFTGMVHHGAKRVEHIQHLKERYKDKFQVLGDGGPNHRKHGRDLANLFASVKVVIAPDGPCTDRYWSNRVYLTTGLGGYLMHPMCKGVWNQYGTTLCQYSSRMQLDDFVDDALNLPDDVIRKLATAGYSKTMEKHTYTHRCRELIKMVQEVL